MKQSAFFLTISTNSTDESIRPKLKAAFQKLYSSFPTFLKFRYQGHDSSLIKKISAPAVSLERGGNQHREHIHALILIDHNTNIQVDTTKVKQFIDSELEVSCYVDVQFIRKEDIDRVKYYIFKQNASNLKL